MAAEDIRDEDRDEALALLRRHWDARTLDPGEHERRTTLVRNAHTRDELDEAVRGLPALGGSSGPLLTGPRGPGGTVGPAGEYAGGGASTPSPIEERPRTNGLLHLDERTARTVMALVPFLAVFLFFGLNMPWWVFLLIPVVGIVIHGGDDRKGRRERRGRDR